SSLIWLTAWESAALTVISVKLKLAMGLALPRRLPSGASKKPLFSGPPGSRKAALGRFCPCRGRQKAATVRPLLAEHPSRDNRPLFSGHPLPGSHLCCVLQK